MKNDEGDFCNFELCGFVYRFLYYNFMWEITVYGFFYLLMGFFIMVSLLTKTMI